MSKRLCVLVVEDNAADVELVREHMSDSGFISFQIDSVSRLSEAIVRLEGGSFDLLLIDLGLPDSRGLETFYKLRKAAPNTPVIILTGHDDEGTAMTAVRNGAQDYLIKGEIIGNTLVRAAQYAVERKRAEVELQERESKLKTLLEILPVGVSILDAENKITFLNSALERILKMFSEGLLRGDYKNRTYLRSDGTPMAAKEFASARAMAEQRAVHNVETGVVKEDGTVIWTSVSAVPVTYPDWKVVIVTTDITERKRAEEEIRQKAKELQEKNNELTRFTYTVSHDLKSPLVTIHTFLGYLEQDARKPDPEGVDKDLRYIRAAADKMVQLLDELLELSRVGRKMNPSVETPLQAIVQEALELVAGRIAERGVKVEVTEEPVLLYGDRSRLVEIFQNMVDNAVKFMGDEPAPHVEIGVEKTGEEIVLFVRDNGIGIDPKHQPKLFSLFEKLDPGTEGTGMGLALVRRIVEVHGGRIWVESEGRDKGTTFRFTLAKTRQGLR